MNLKLEWKKSGIEIKMKLKVKVNENGNEI